MAKRGRRTVEITLSAEERATLERWARRHSSSQVLALRCRIVLAAADGKTNTEIARELRINQVTASSSMPGPTVLNVPKPAAWACWRTEAV